MRLNFNQVSGPNFSGVSQALATGQQSISRGISSIGDTVTNLGKRREARAEKARGEQGARALENFKLQAVNADANSLAGLAQGGAPVGAADFIAKRQRSLLDNDSVRAGTEGTRASTAGTVESTRGSRILNDGAQVELDASKGADSFQKEYGADIVEANRLASQGQGEAASAVLDRVLGSAAPKYGSDIVLSTIDSLNARTRDGSTTRTQVSNDDTSVLQGKANLESTNIGNEGSILSNKAQRISNESAQGNLDRQNADLASTDIVNSTIARAVNGASSAQDALISIQNNPDLSPEEKLRASAGAQEILSTPNALDTFSPIDPFNQSILDSGAAGSNSPDFSRVSDFVEGAARAELNRSPSQQIFRTAEEISPDVEHVSIEATLAERYPDQKFSSKDINSIHSVMNNNNITKREAIAIIDRSIGKRGNVGGLLGVGKPLKNLVSSKNRNDREFRQGDFNDIVETYTQEVSQGNLQVDRGQRERDVASAQALESQYKDAITARARAVQTHGANSPEVQRYDQVISNLNLQARGLEQGSFKLEDLNRNQAQSTSERIFDPHRNPNSGLLNFEDLIGISDTDRELRTRRTLNRGK